MTDAANSDRVIAIHVRNATASLLHALHYHRFFGAPIDGFCDEHNRARRESNDRQIAALALQAGQSARFAGQLCEAWEARCATALAVPAIRAGFEFGWLATDRDLTSSDDDEPALPEVQL